MINIFYLISIATSKKSTKNIVFTLTSIMPALTSQFYRNTVLFYSVWCHILLSSCTDTKRKDHVMLLIVYNNRPLNVYKIF